MDGDRILLEYKLPWQEVVSDLHDQVDECVLLCRLLVGVEVEVLTETASHSSFQTWNTARHNERYFQHGSGCGATA